MAKNGIITGVLMDPMIPYVTDMKENVQEMVKKAKHHGAKYIYLSTQVTMADVQRDYFYQEVEKLRFIEFGNKNNKLLMFIHGAVIPWQMWLPQIEYFSKDYFIIIPVLDGHDIDNISIFTTIEKAASDIENHCMNQYGRNIFAVSGMSMGGTIISVMLEHGLLKFNKVIIESAPIVPMNKLILFFWTKQVLNQIKGMKARRNSLIKQAKHIYPKDLFENILDLIDHIDEKTIYNYCASTFLYKLPINMSTKNADIVYWHGTTFMEIMAKKSAKYIKKHYPLIEVKSFYGYNHCELSVNLSEQYINEIERVLKR